MGLSGGRIKKCLHNVLLKLAGINDKPHKIALGFAIGVFTGIIPGIGPLAAMFTSGFFRANIPAALIGSLCVNTWISLVLFFPAVKIGSILCGVESQSLSNEWQTIINDFQISRLFSITASRIIFPVMLGYFSLGFIIAGLSFVIALLALKRWPGKNY